jgi:serine/threonine protein kinase
VAVIKPQTFGRYLLLDKVASGGMAEVWRAKLTGEQGFQRIYAIKKILPHVAEDTEFITMFTDEALITSSLQHSNIGQVFEFSKLGDTYYIAMEYISGKDLKTVWSYCRSRKTTLPLELAAYITQKMADGLDYAHRRTDNFGNDAGVVHRDVSPQNVLLSWDGEVKVIDFGIAKASEKSGKTRPGTLKGKFAYMSPEQIRGLNLDGRADIFAIGVVLYELCTGERGFSADSEFSLLEMVRNVEIKPPTIVNREIPAELERIIFKALAKDREHRYQTASDLSEDLQRFLMSRGKPPNRQDLSAFLRTNFTVDFEKERARLESYKELTAEESAPMPPSPKSQSAEEQLDDFTSAWDGPGGASESGAFASGPNNQSQPRVQQNTGIRPAAPVRPPPVAVDTIANKTPVNVDRPGQQQQQQMQRPSGGGARLFAIAAGITLVLVGAGAAAWWLMHQGSGTVVVTVTGAPGGTVRFDDRPPTRAEPSVTIEKVKTGPHTLIVEEGGFVTFSTQIVTTDQTPLFPVKAPLKRLSGKLNVSSEPSGALIVLDGKETEYKTPASVEVEGETLHEVEVRLPSYKDARKSDVKVAVAAEQSVRLKLVPSRVKIQIITNPPGATLFVNAQPAGTTPVTIERNPDDSPPLAELSLKGCETYRTTIPVDAEKLEQTYPISLKCK